MINQFVGIIGRSIVAILALFGGVFVIIYVMIWDTIREKILRKKPIKNPCFEKTVVNEDIVLSKPKSITNV